METVRLSNEVSLSRIIQGFWRLGSWKWSDEELTSFIKGCIDLGVTSFDTAEIYGASEELLGRALKKEPSLRDQIQIITKTGISRYVSPDGLKRVGYYDTRKEHVLQACEASLRRLNTDHVDVYLIHREDPCIDHWETAEALQTLIKQGRILSAGVSNFDPFKLEALNQAMEGKLVTNQIELNPFCFEHFDSGMMDTLVRLKMPPMAWSPLQGGQVMTGMDEEHVALRAKLQPLAEEHGVGLDTLIYAWLLYHPAKVMPISGSRELSRLRATVAALDVKLDHWQWYEIYTASGQKILR